MLVSSNRSSLASCYHRHGAEKRCHYRARVRDVEHAASFVPVVMSCVDGLTPAASATLKRLAILVSDQQDKPYNTVIA